MKAKRGCKKPGEDYEGSQVFRYTSPYLQDGDDMLNECPVGKIMRESPHVYDAIAAHTYSENGALNPLECSPWLQAAIRVVGSERGRLEDMRQEEQRNKVDAKRGQSLRKRRGNHN